MSIVRLDECERNRRFMPSEARQKNFDKIKNKGPKIHSFALKLYTGASKFGGQGAPGPRAPPGSASGLSYLAYLAENAAR